jgi:outer membrane lipoprotein-sorting protein
MKRIKHAITLASLVAISAIGLYGCGGENPTAVVVQPTATTAVEQATATTALAASTATTASVADATATTASGGTGSVSGSADDILRQSGQVMSGVKSYHIILKTEAAGISTSGEGDFVLPDKARMTMDSGAAGKTQLIVIGNTIYTQVPGSDAYIELPGTSSPLGAASDPAALANLAQNATVVGDETVDGVNTTHITFSYDANKSLESAGVTPTTDLGTVNADIWVEKSTGYIRQFKTASTLAGNQTSTQVNYSKFNEDVTPPIEKPTNIQQMPTIPTIPSP